MAGYSVIEERSAGAVLFCRLSNRPEYLLLHYKAGHWDFPKGNIEKGETEIRTIKREVYEETGIRDIYLVPEFRRKVMYHYRRGEGLVYKEVTFVLADSPTKEVKISHEHVGYAWLSYEEALSRITFENSRSVLSDAQKYLKHHSTGKKESLESYM